MWNATGHLDSPLPANVVMNDTLGKLMTGDGTNKPTPTYAGGKCNNTYCHGNWVLRKASSRYTFVYSDSMITGAKYSPQWTGGSIEAICGSCHGLPPQGHRDLSPVPCSNCHGGVVDANNRIIDPTKHINGKINLDDVEFGMR
jgi:predicted CxxxxCH...CXXCH cytochrome family protein